MEATNHKTIGNLSELLKPKTPTRAITVAVPP